jgi:predicted dehydrogenase
MTSVALIGAGIMGSNHARVLQSLPTASLVAVVDSDPAKGEVLAAAHGVPYFQNAKDVLGSADAAVLATPSESHADIGSLLLEGGLDLLVEKPIASTSAEAERLVAAATAANRILMVGHIERFNPAILELDRILKDPVHLEMTRMGPFSPRVTADVVLDLMIHDIDLALSIVKSPVADVRAVGQTVRSDSVDIASALLRFANGVTANLTASRVGQTKIRTVEITQEANFVVVDLLRQDVTIHRVDHNEYLSTGGAGYRQTGLIEIPFLEHRGEPLGLELKHFVECVTTRTSPRVGGSEGAQALAIALQIGVLATQHN